MLANCPVPINEQSCIQLAHGGGGALMQELLEQHVFPYIGPQDVSLRHDAASLNFAAGQLAFTTDSYVVSPLFFPGGDIGSLAVYGTVNDLAMAGAKPLALSCALILEEGFLLADLERILGSMRQAAAHAKVSIVTGDTKVVERGKADGIYINTSGVGLIPSDLCLRPDQIVPGDGIIVSGDIGRHGLAILAARQGLAFEHAITSDCAPLYSEVDALLQAGLRPHCLRDLTRGGLASVLCELAQASQHSFSIDEHKIAVPDDVRIGCEILGLDPLYLANEGRFVIFCAAVDTEQVLAILPDAKLIGQVDQDPRGFVRARNQFATERLLSLHLGEQLPRIC